MYESCDTVIVSHQDDRNKKWDLGQQTFGGGGLISLINWKAYLSE